MNQEITSRTNQEVRTRLQHGLTEFLAVIDHFSDQQMLGPMDTAGWNVRDHLTHLAVWAEGIAALLRREDRWAAMSVVLKVAQDDEPDYDLLNGQLVEQYRHLSPTEARAWLIAAHERVLTALDTLTETELAAPYGHFVAPYTETWGEPIAVYILGNTEDHYDDHTPWVRAIVEAGSASGNNAGRT
jgi:hypothetical protein